MPDIVEAISCHVRLERDGDVFVGVCPLCGKGKLTVNPDSQTASCDYEGISWTLYGFARRFIERRNGEE